MRLFFKERIFDSTFNIGNYEVDVYSDKHILNNKIISTHNKIMLWNKL